MTSKWGVGGRVGGYLGVWVGTSVGGWKWVGGWVGHNVFNRDAWARHCFRRFADFNSASDGLTPFACCQRGPAATNWGQQSFPFRLCCVLTSEISISGRNNLLPTGDLTGTDELSNIGGIFFFCYLLLFHFSIRQRVAFISAI